jgi:hypothetical protein
MEGNPFIINVRVNKNKFFRAFINFGCLCYAIISKKHVIRFNLPRINILSRLMKEFGGKNITTFIINIIYVNVNIDEYERRLYFYEIFYQNYDIIFGRPWLKDNHISVNKNGNYLKFKYLNFKVRNIIVDVFNQKRNHAFLNAYMFIKNIKRDKFRVYAVSFADINKALRPKPTVNVDELLPPQYHPWKQAFDRTLANTLAQHRPSINLQIPIKKDANGEEKPLF